MQEKRSAERGKPLGLSLLRNVKPEMYCGHLCLSSHQKIRQRFPSETAPSAHFNYDFDLRLGGWE